MTSKTENISALAFIPLYAADTLSEKSGCINDCGARALYVIQMINKQNPEMI